MHNNDQPPRETSSYRMSGRTTTNKCPLKLDGAQVSFSSRPKSSKPEAKRPPSSKRSATNNKTRKSRSVVLEYSPILSKEYKKSSGNKRPKSSVEVRRRDSKIEIYLGGEHSCRTTGNHSPASSNDDDDDDYSLSAFTHYIRDDSPDAWAHTVSSTRSEAQLRNAHRVKSETDLYDPQEAMNEKHRVKSQPELYSPQERHSLVQQDLVLSSFSDEELMDLPKLNLQADSHRLSSVHDAGSNEDAENISETKMIEQDSYRNKQDIETHRLNNNHIPETSSKEKQTETKTFKLNYRVKPDQGFEAKVKQDSSNTGGFSQLVSDAITTNLHSKNVLQEIEEFLSRSDTSFPTFHFENEDKTEKKNYTSGSKKIKTSPKLQEVPLKQNEKSNIEEGKAERRGSTYDNIMNLLNNLDECDDGLSSAPAVNTPQEVRMLELELKEKNRALSNLQKSNDEEKDKLLKAKEANRKEYEEKMKIMKENNDVTLQRHQAFIDQLLAEKQSLSTRCEMLVKDINELQQKHQSTLKAIDERHQIQVQRVKDQQAAAERARRDKWIQDKTRKIKEMTVKGLEPEIQNLMDRHKTELEQLAVQHEANLRKLQHDDEESTREQLHQLRVQLIREREEACIREKEHTRVRLQKQHQEEKDKWEQKKMELEQQVTHEQEKFKEEVKRCNEEKQDVQKALEGRVEAEVEKIKERHSREIEVLSKQCEESINSNKADLEAEKKSWKREQLAREREEKEKLAIKLREESKRERDSEIHRLVEQLEADMMKNKQEVQKEADLRIRQAKEKYQHRLKEQEEAEQELRTRCNHLRGQLAQKDEELICSVASLNQKSKELQQANENVAIHNAERNSLSAVIRREFENKINELEGKIKQFQHDQDQLERKYRKQLQELQDESTRKEQEKEKVLEELHTRVKSALKKKEDVNTQLRQDYHTLLLRNNQLEEALNPN